MRKILFQNPRQKILSLDLRCRGQRQKQVCKPVTGKNTGNSLKVDDDAKTWGSTTCCTLQDMNVNDSCVC